MDAAFTTQNDETQLVYLFVGKDYFVFDRDRELVENRTSIVDGWGIDGPVDAAFESNKTVYLIKGEVRRR